MLGARIGELLSLGALTLLTASCSTDEGPGPEETLVIGEDPWIIVHGFSSGPEALLHLELEYVAAHNCLVVHGVSPDTGEIAYSGIPVWPEGVEPLKEGGDVGVTVPELGPLLDGEAFTAGGGGASQELIVDVELPDEGCLPADGFVPLNPDSISTE